MAGPLQGEGRRCRLGQLRRVRKHGADLGVAQGDGAVEPPARADGDGALADGPARQVGNVEQIAGSGAHVGAAPGDIRIAADGEERQAGNHQADGVVGRRFHAGDDPKVRQVEAEVRIVGEQGAAGGRARWRDRQAVAARPADPGEEVAERRDLAVGREARSRVAAVVDQACPDLRPVFAIPQLQHVEPDKPVDIGAGEAAEGDDVLGGPRLALQAENRILDRQGFGRRLIMVDPGNETIHPGAGLRRHRLDDRRRGAAEVEQAQAVVDVVGERAAHFRDPAPGDALDQRHLAEPEVRVHKPEGERRVAVVLGLDERDLMRVPMDRHRPFERQVLRRERRQPLLHGALSRQRRQQRAAAEQAAHQQCRHGSSEAPHRHPANLRQ